MDDEILAAARWIVSNTSGRFRRRILNHLTWYANEKDGKYTTRYRSREAVRLQEELGRTAAMKHLAHEHVTPRKTLIDRLIKSPGEVETILESAIACVITRDEHERLPDGEGWDRYKQAAIEVVDTQAE